MPNLLLIAGNGRNVGKTELACRLIRQLSKSGPVTGVKISPHFHPHDPQNVLEGNENFIILEEKQTNKKDSSLMLQSGAERVFFVMVKRDKYPEAFEALQKLLPAHPVVCEAGGLHEVVEPGLFFFVNMQEREIKKEYLLNNRPVLVTNDGKKFEPSLKELQFNGTDYTF